jgi:hypothetical protein
MLINGREGVSLPYLPARRGVPRPGPARAALAARPTGQGAHTARVHHVARLVRRTPCRGWSYATCRLAMRYARALAWTSPGEALHVPHWKGAALLYFFALTPYIFSFTLFVSATLLFLV